MAEYCSHAGTLGPDDCVHCRSKQRKRFVVTFEVTENLLKDSPAYNMEKQRLTKGEMLEWLVQLDKNWLMQVVSVVAVLPEA